MGQFHYHVCSFLLEGKAVQGVKLRRYCEAAGRWAGNDVGGYCINTEDGGVFGEAWIQIEEGNDDCSDSGSLNRFYMWIKGQHTPKEYTNIKPTPIGPAYPLKAQVDEYAVLLKKVQVIDDDSTKGVPVIQYYETFKTFSMVRDDQEASKIASERKEIYVLLKTKLSENTEVNQSHDGQKRASGAGEEQSTRTTSGEMIEIGSWPKREV